MIQTIYQSEIDAGIEEQIRSKASITYEVPILFENVTMVPFQEGTPAHVVANLSDLFPMNSILASTGWNLNDDVFDPVEMWQARSSAANKPFNMEHSQRDIIGHITSSYPVDTDLNQLPDDLDVADIPQSYHLMTSAVIYTSYPDDPDFQASIAQIIEEIKAGQWFVSMECLFQGFDYSLLSADGSQTIVPRDMTTAHLTKHLRIYKGQGSYEGNKLGRVLKNITFSGKGLVRKPANPSSIILPSAPNFNNTRADVVYSLNESEPNNVLSEKSKMDSQELITKLEAAVAKLTSEKETLASQLADASVKSYQSKATELTETVQAKDSEIATLKTENESLKAAVQEAATRIIAAEKDVVDTKKNFMELKKKQAKSDRIAKLVAANNTVEAAESLVAAFENIDEDAFDAVVLLSQNAGTVNIVTPNSNPLIAVLPAKTPHQYVQDMINKTSKSNAPQVNTSQASTWEDTLSNLNVQDDSATASVASTEEVSAVESTRASIADFMKNRGIGQLTSKNTK